MTEKTPEEFVADNVTALPDNNPNATVPATFRAQFKHIADSTLFKSNAVDILDTILESSFWRKTALNIEDIEGLQDALEVVSADIAGDMIYKGEWDATTGMFPYDGGAVRAGHFYRVSEQATVDDILFHVGDYIFATINNPSVETFLNNWQHLSLYVDDKLDVDAGMSVVTHGATASTARPANAAAVYWIGSVEPVNAIDSDLWHNTSA